MRRIPRTQRSIEATISSSHLLRPRLTSSPCRASVTPYSCPQITSAAFSTSTRYNFLDGKQDKKKHQAFVRRWQKRLLGESEPIGAHVDPYDPTSPVRIRPDEQGEELEVLEEAKLDEYGKPIEAPHYEKAESGEGLSRVGTKEWIAEQEEWQLIERFEKLLAKPFPVLDYTFGPDTKVTDTSVLQEKFHQAVVETYTLKQAGAPITAIPYPADANYDPSWTKAVWIEKSSNGSPGLKYSNDQIREQSWNFVGRSIKGVEAPAEQQVAEEVEEVIEELVGGVETVAGGAKPASTEATKQPKSNPFDFMSNRPVPRARFEEPTPATEEIIAETAEAQPAKFDIEGATEKSRKDVATARHAVLESSARKSEDAVAALRNEIRDDITKLASDEVLSAKPDGIYAGWQAIPLTNPSIKFALSKRLIQLTGLRISDPRLNDCKTLSDFWGHLVTASKPKPTKLYDQIRLESTLHRNKKKPGMEQLKTLPNVKIYGKRISPMQKEKQVGRWKVIEYALAERGLPILPKDEPRDVPPTLY